MRENGMYFFRLGNQSNPGHWPCAGGDEPSGAWADHDIMDAFESANGGRKHLRNRAWAGSNFGTTERKNRQATLLALDPATERNYRHNCEDSFAEEMIGLLKDSIHLRLRADVPVGAYLSGGLDSSVPAALIHRECLSSFGLFP